MNVPPAILDLTVAPPERHRVHLWLPIFLLWPFVLVIGILALACTIAVDFILVVLGKPYHHYTVLLFRSFEVMTETRGLAIRINDGKTNVDMTFQ